MTKELCKRVKEEGELLDLHLSLFELVDGIDGRNTLCQSDLAMS